jgi:putative ABC transport system substrate-binding protein
VIGRREFIALLGGAAGWPLAAWAQEGERVRHIGVFMPAAADNAETYRARIEAFQQALGQLGWTIGRNLRIDTRWATTNADRMRTFAAELVALAPDVILASGDTAMPALRQATRTSQLCSFRSPTQSAPGSSTAWRGRKSVGWPNCFSGRAGSRCCPT